MDKPAQLLPDLEASLSFKMPKVESPFTQRWKQKVDPAYADLVCVFLCFLTGLCDSSAYNAWSCFLGMQTGNTVFLGLGASNQPTTKPWGWLKSLVSIASFFIGALFFNIFMRYIGPLRRGSLFLSFFIQFCIIVISVALIQADLIPHSSSDVSLDNGLLFLELISIALLAFQSAGSMTCSRLLGYNEIPTVVLTSVYFDIATDGKLLAAPAANVKRNRRMGSVIALLIGAICGGWLSRSNGGMESALWMAAGFKLFISFGWFFWKAE